MENLNEKLDKLNPAEFAKTDANIIRGWKERVPKLMAQADWQQHPITQDLKKDMLAAISDLKEKLSSDPKLPAEERAALFGEKNAYQFLINAMSQRPESELEAIEQAVNLET